MMGNLIEVGANLAKFGDQFLQHGYLGYNLLPDIDLALDNHAADVFRHAQVGGSCSGFNLIVSLLIKTDRHRTIILIAISISAMG